MLASLASWDAAEDVIEATLQVWRPPDTRVSVRYGAVLVLDEGAGPTKVLAIAESRLDSVVPA